jgi:hypothetical protein
MTKTRAAITTLILGAFIAALTLTSPALPTFGATILTTSASDTLTTFRTNVNTSLTNLNTDKLELSDLSALDKGFFFSTTSTDYWQTQRNFFSTTSADHWKTDRNFFSTTSADYWGTNKGYATFGYLFPNNATTTGLGIYASSTIGNGSQTSGLTISGGATTTGHHRFLSNLLLSSGSTINWNNGNVTLNGATSNTLTVSSSGSVTTFQIGTDPDDGLLSLMNGDGSLESIQPAGGASPKTYTLPGTTGTLTIGSGSSGRISYWNGTNSLTSEAALAYNDTANRLTFDFASSSVLSAATLCLTGDTCISTWPSSGSSFAYPFPSNATTTVLNFSNGLTAASTTVSGTSTTARLNVTGAVSILGEYFTNFTTYVRSIIASANLVVTGAWDFGGATSLEIPNGSNPTLDAIGEIALDTSVNQLLFATSTNASAPAVIHGFVTMSAGHATSSWTGTTTQLLAPAPFAGYVAYARCETLTGTVGVSLYDGTNRANFFTASTTIGTITYSTNYSFTAGESIRVDFGTPASSPTQVACRFLFYPTRS